jgi:hypothetical protein
MDELLVTKRRTALILGEISIRSVEYLLATGQLEGRQMGRRKLVTRRSIERLARADVLRIAPPKPGAAVSPQEPVR